MEDKTYKILITPEMRVACIGLTIKEAAAWISTYNRMMANEPLKAIIAEEEN